MRDAKRPALVFEGRRWTFAELARDVDAVARGLIDLGIGPGDKVSLWMMNRPEWIHAALAVMRIGAVLVPINTRLRTDDAAYLLAQSDSTTLFAGDLRRSIDRAQWPITYQIKRRDEILNLLDQPAEQLSKPETWQKRIDSQSSHLVAFVKDNVLAKLHPTEFEELVKVLVESDFENIKVTAGPTENGADLVMSVTAPFFDDLPVVVQIKHHLGQEDDDTTSVDQLRQAFDYYRPSSHFSS